MNINIKIFLLCPVPEEQKPINEYIQLKENDLTNWVTFAPTPYFQKLVSLAGTNFFGFYVCQIFPVLVLFPKRQEFFVGAETLLHPAGNALLLLSLFLVFNWVRWKQVEGRVKKSRLFYEEASWYDGQIWEKPFPILKNDALLRTQKIQPLLQRMQNTLWGTLSLSFSIFSFSEICRSTFG
jgi:hypothetical protein